MYNLTYTDRLTIEKLYNQKTPYREIARRIGKSHVTVMREIKRGLYDHFIGSEWLFVKRYSADIAQDTHDFAQTSKGRPIALGKNYAYAREIKNRVASGESPDAIVGDKRNKNEWTVSTPTLYRYIDNGYIPGVTNAQLIVKGKKKKRKHKKIRASRAPAGKSIEARPRQINSRKEFGHWEMDTVIGKKKGLNQVLLVLTERKTRFELIYKLKDKTADSVVTQLRKVFEKFGHLIKTITVDNGCEFADAIGMERDPSGNKRCDVYYCHPYSSGERGSNENANRLIRRYLPKGTDFRDVTQADCDSIAYMINHMHRKILHYLTAQECFEAEALALSPSS